MLSHFSDICLVDQKSPLWGKPGHFWIHFMAKSTNGKKLCFETLSDNSVLNQLPFPAGKETRKGVEGRVPGKFQDAPTFHRKGSPDRLPGKGSQKVLGRSNMSQKGFPAKASRK